MDNFPNFFQFFTEYNNLIKKGKTKCKYTGDELALEDNLFGTKGLKINDTLYPLLGNDTIENLIKEVFPNLLEVLIENEKYYLFENAMDLKEIWEYDSFQDFLRSGEYSSEHTEDYVRVYFKFYDEESNDYFGEDEILEFLNEYDDANLDELTPVFLFEDNNGGEDELEDWSKDPSMRLRVMMKKINNPNYFAEDHLLDMFKRIEAIEIAENHPAVSEFYSDYDSYKVAFNIKVWDSFVHPGLYELGVLDDDTDWFNRNNAIENFIESLSENKKMKDVRVNNWGCDGRSSGYLIITFDDLDPEVIEYVSDRIQEEKKTTPIEFQSLEMYEYRFDEIEDELLELREEAMENNDKSKVEQIDVLLKEMGVEIEKIIDDKNEIA